MIVPGLVDLLRLSVGNDKQVTALPLSRSTVMVLLSLPA